MPLSANAYGTVAEVEAYTSHLIEAGATYSTSTRPTLAQVEQFIERRSAMLNGCLAEQGYITPVTTAQAKLVLDYYAVMGASGDCELSMRSAGYDAEDGNRRENKFLKEFEAGCAYIATGAFAALGAPKSGASSPISGLYVGGRAMGGQPLRPIFGRTGLGNDPTRNSPRREPPWNEEE
jgi:hypothetical protein